MISFALISDVAQMSPLLFSQYSTAFSISNRQVICLASQCRLPGGSDMGSIPASGRYPGEGDTLEKEKAIHSSILD